MDHFKRVNDMFGHAAGDVVLRETARRLRKLVRASDVVARAGGDEFAVVLDDIAARTTRCASASASSPNSTAASPATPARSTAARAWAW